MSRVHVDANVILRFLRNDDPQQSPRAASLFQHAQSSDDIEMVVSVVTLMEVFPFLPAPTNYLAQRPPPCLPSSCTPASSRARMPTPSLPRSPASPTRGLPSATPIWPLQQQRKTKRSPPSIKASPVLKTSDFTRYDAIADGVFAFVPPLPWLPDMDSNHD